MAKFKMGDYKTIKIRSYIDVQEEHRAAVAGIMPGMFVTYGTPANGEITVTNAGTAGTVPNPLFVVTEDELQGKTILDAYAEGDPIQCWMPTRGDIVLASVANTQTIAVGAKLTVDAKGRVTVTATGNTVIGTALTAITTTTEPGFVQVLIG